MQGKWPRWLRWSWRTRRRFNCACQSWCSYQRITKVMALLAVAMVSRTCCSLTLWAKLLNVQWRSRSRVKKCSSWAMGTRASWSDRLLVAMASCSPVKSEARIRVTAIHTCERVNWEENGTCQKSHVRWDGIIFLGHLTLHICDHQSLSLEHQALEWCKRSHIGHKSAAQEPCDLLIGGCSARWGCCECKSGQRRHPCIDHCVNFCLCQVHLEAPGSQGFFRLQQSSHERGWVALRWVRSVSIKSRSCSWIDWWHWSSEQLSLGVVLSDLCCYATYDVHNSDVRSGGWLFKPRSLSVTFFA